MIALVASLLYSLITLAATLQWGMFGPGVKLVFLACQYALFGVAIACAPRCGGSSLRLGSRALPYLVYLLLATTLAVTTLGGIYSADESCYRFQSRILHSGEFAAPSPVTISQGALTSRDMFIYHHIANESGWFTKYPPGWPAALAVFGSLLPEWSINPLLGLLAMVLAAAIARKLFDQTTATLTAWLLALSPIFVTYCNGFFSHPWTLVALCGATLCTLHAREKFSIAWGAGAAAALVAAFLARPFTAVCVGAVLGAWLLPLARARFGRFFVMTIVGGAIVAAGAGLFVAYNHHFTGKWHQTLYAYYEGADETPEVKLTLGHLWEALLHEMPHEIGETLVFGAPLLAVVCLIAFARDRENRSKHIFLLALFSSLVLGYLVQSEDSDSPFGERYYFETYFALCIIAARGALLLSSTRRLGVRSIGAAQFVFTALACFSLYNLKRPYRLMEEYVARAPGPSLVIFTDGDLLHFHPQRFNPNGPRWTEAPVLTLPKPKDLSGLSEIARSLHRAKWQLVRYDEVSKQIVEIQHGSAPGDGSATLQ